MSDEKWTRDQKIAAVASAAAVVSVTFSIFAPMSNADGPLYTILNAAASMGIGVFLGYALTRMLYNQKLSEKDAEIAELRQRPTPEEIEAAQSAQSALDEYDRARREARSAFRSLSARDMELIIGLYESGVRTVGEPDPIIAVLGQRGIVRKALDSPLVIDLDPKWRARIDAFRDVFDDVYGKKKV